MQKPGRGGGRLVGHFIAGRSEKQAVVFMLTAEAAAGLTAAERWRPLHQDALQLLTNTGSLLGRRSSGAPSAS